MASAPEKRVDVTVRRSHKRFQLKELAFSHQFSHMYYDRLRVLGPRAEEQASARWPGVLRTRVLDVAAGPKVVCIGTVYKQIANYRGFLAEYLKEQIKMRAADEEEEAELETEVEDTPDILAPASKSVTQLQDTLCSDKDYLLLEDDSGRLDLGGEIPVARLVTGVTIAVCGHLEGSTFCVESWCVVGMPPQPSIPRPHHVDTLPVYIAFISGLGIGNPDPEVSQSLDTFVDYICGNVANNVVPAARIARLVVAGNLIESTEDMRLKHKIRLEPGDHGTKGPSTGLTAVTLMRHADRILADVAGSIPLDVMPGDTDPTNCFFPQQAIHPVTLPTAARKSTMRMVTNPFEFSVDGAVYLGTSGENVHDIMRQTTDGMTELDAQELIVTASNLCPTAPNTLPCYPFKGTDPFLMETCPHVLFTGNQKCFATKVVHGANGQTTRLVSIPSFAATGEIVLVDTSSPDFHTQVVSFR